MCGRKLKIFLSSSALLLLLSLSPLSASLFADVILTDQEATELLNEIEQSKTELESVKNELAESKKELNELKVQQEDVKNTYDEQKIYYETQLEEAKKQKEQFKTLFTITSSTTAVALLFSIILLLL